MKNFLRIISCLFIIFTVGCSNNSGGGSFPSLEEKKGQQLFPPKKDQQKNQLPVHIQKFNNLVKQIRDFIEKKSSQRRSKFFSRSHL